MQIFYMPLALVVPPSIFFVHSQFNMLYQFWIHTEVRVLLFLNLLKRSDAHRTSFNLQVKKFKIKVMKEKLKICTPWLYKQIVRSLGPLEYILNTPSHHRVHHGKNKCYIFWIITVSLSFKALFFCFDWVAKTKLL